MLDDESKRQVQKYYHRVDSVRESSSFRAIGSMASHGPHGIGGLIGRLLPRMLLKDKGVQIDAMRFAKTQAGKPYIASPESFVVKSLLTSHP